jgi:hypothetical protein
LKLNREYLSGGTQPSLISYIDCEVMHLYEVKVFIGNKEVKKIDDQQRRAMLEKALSTFHKKDVKVSCVK